MKMLKKYFLFFISLPFIASGCYTVLWTPQDDFPVTNDYGYDSYYYDEYYYYYDYPWWLSITPPVKYRTDDDKGYERDKSTSTIRNNGNGRNTDSGREVLNTPPPSRTYTPPSTGSNNSSETGSTNTRTESVDSGNSSRQGSGSNSGSLRNTDGNRNNGRGR